MQGRDKLVSVSCWSPNPARGLNTDQDELGGFQNHPRPCTFLPTPNFVTKSVIRQQKVIVCYPHAALTQELRGLPARNTRSVKWNALGTDFHKLLYGYWASTWAVQVPLRCIALARAVSGGWGRRCVITATGLNLIWFTAPQDVIYHFFWWGIYDANYPYFSYLPPEGLWNLWNMLLLRVPIGITIGVLLIRGGRCEGQWSLLTRVLFWCANSAIGLYAMYFIYVCTR